MITPEIKSAIAQAVAAAIAERFPSSRETYLKVREAAAQLSCHGDTVLRLVHQGKLRATGSGKLTRIPQSAIAEYLNSSSAPKCAVTA
jgi:excisionase family DNA binding protein